jgi:hypothetical protein
VTKVFLPGSEASKIFGKNNLVNASGSVDRDFAPIGLDEVEGVRICKDDGPVFKVCYYLLSLML